MNINKFKQFLMGFDLSDEFIEKYVQDKLMVKNDKFYFLMSNKDKMLLSKLVFMQLAILVPTVYLLKVIAENSVVIKIKNEKQALSYTYGKDLKFQSILNREELKEGKQYVVEYDDKILGYAKYERERDFSIINLFNVGMYLKEE